MSDETEGIFEPGGPLGERPERESEEEQRIYDHLRSRLPMMDAKARIPRTDLRRAVAAL